MIKHQLVSTLWKCYPSNTNMKSIVVSVADSFELFESPNGLACDHLIGLQDKAVLLTKKKGWVKLELRQRFFLDKGN